MNIWIFYVSLMQSKCISMQMLQSGFKSHHRGFKYCTGTIEIFLIG